MEIDGPVAPGPSGNNEWRARAERSIHESRDHKALARREKKDALRVLCQDRGLDDTLCKIELAKQLITWVGSTFSPYDDCNLVCVAQHPSTSR